MRVYYTVFASLGSEFMYISTCYIYYMYAIHILNDAENIKHVCKKMKRENEQGWEKDRKRFIQYPWKSIGWI